MRVAALAEIAISNVVLLAAIAAVLQDQAGRLAYFRSLGFIPSTTYYPFFYITSAVNGSTRIQGLLTLDWVQVLGAALIILDLGFAVSFMRHRRLAKEQVSPATTPLGPEPTKTP